MEEEIIKHEEGKCPYCNSENILYGSFELSANEGYYEITCQNCEKTSKEWYRLIYIETRG